MIAVSSLALILVGTICAILAGALAGRESDLHVAGFTICAILLAGTGWLLAVFG